MGKTWALGSDEALNSGSATCFYREHSLRRKKEVHAQVLRPVQLFATPWTPALQAPLSVEFSSQGY